MIHLGVNIDHVATVRQARLTDEPDPVEAAFLAMAGGAHGITIHLRGDRRHIQERDVRLLRETVRGSVNLEMALAEDIIDLALAIRPHAVCLVPENRAELTTEGGLDLSRDPAGLAAAIARLRAVGILVSLFINPNPEDVRQAVTLGADAVELHTGTWANALADVHAMTGTQAAVDTAMDRLQEAADTAAVAGIRLHAGHGLRYDNVGGVLHLPLLRELNIGHSIIARAMMVGMQQAVRDMVDLINPCH